MKDGMIDFKLFEGFCFMMDGRTDEQTDRRTDICKLYMYVHIEVKLRYSRAAMGVYFFEKSLSFLSPFYALFLKFLNFLKILAQN